MKTRLILLAVLASALLLGCSDDAQTTSGGEAVKIDVAPLELLDFGWVQYQISIFDNAGERVFTQVVDTDSYGAPNGSILFVGPCVAGADGSSQNMATVEILDVRTAPPADGGETVDGLVLPPAESQVFTCTENADVRVSFTFVVARQADQGFADITVDIEDVFCSAKVSCETDLHPHPETGVRGPTLVTGFACTGDANATNAENYIGFEALLCCNGDLPASGDCTAVTIDDTAGNEGAPLLSPLGAGVFDVDDYVGFEDILGKVYHNTSWLVDPATVGTGCEFWGFGFVNHDPAGSPGFAYNGNDSDDGIGAAPAFHFRASLDTNGTCQTGVESCVTIDYNGTMLVDACAAPPAPAPLLFTTSSELSISAVRATSVAPWSAPAALFEFASGGLVADASPDNGEYRWAAEFQTDALTAAEVQSATLRLRNSSGQAGLDTLVTAYAGSGTGNVALDDVDRNGTTTVIVGSDTATEYDVTALVIDALGGGSGFVGFSFRENNLTCDPEGGANCDSVSIFEGVGTADEPLLTIVPN